MNAFTAGLGTLFSDPNLSEAASYVPLAGETVTLRVQFSTHEEVRAGALSAARFSGGFETGTYAPAYVAEIRVADVAEAEEGATLIVGGVSYRIASAKLNNDGLTWLLDLEKQS